MWRPLAFAQAPELTPISLGGPPAAVVAGLGVEVPQLTLGVTAGVAFRRLFVEGLGDGRGAAAVAETSYHDLDVMLWQSEAHEIANAQPASGFRALPIHLDVAAFDRFGGGAPGLVEARRPEPFVEADVRVEVFGHVGGAGDCRERLEAKG